MNINGLYSNMDNRTPRYPLPLVKRGAAPRKGLVIRGVARNPKANTADTQNNANDKPDRANRNVTKTFLFPISFIGKGRPISFESQPKRDPVCSSDTIRLLASVDDMNDLPT